MRAVRWQDYQAVQEDKWPRFTWELVDVKTDAGETVDVAAAHPEIVRQIGVTHDRWWSEILPRLENKNVPLTPVGAFIAAYRRQTTGPDASFRLGGPCPSEGRSGQILPIEPDSQARYGYPGRHACVINGWYSGMSRNTVEIGRPEGCSGQVLPVQPDSEERDEYSGRHACVTNGSYSGTSDKTHGIPRRWRAASRAVQGLGPSNRLLLFRDKLLADPSFCSPSFCCHLLPSTTLLSRAVAFKRPSSCRAPRSAALGAGFSSQFCQARACPGSSMPVPR